MPEIAIIGENMHIRRFEKTEAANGFVSAYTHMDGKIGVLINVESDVVNDAVKEMGKNIAMQAAAMRPTYCHASEIPGDFIEKETEILREICLNDQVYVKAEDGKQSVAKYVEQVAKENGANIAIKGFVRFETGEGLEKKNEDFAAEVAAQAAQ